MNRREFFAAAAVLPMSVQRLNSVAPTIPAFLREPAFSPDVWKAVVLIANELDKQTGLTDVFYGLPHPRFRLKPGPWERVEVHGPSLYR